MQVRVSLAAEQGALRAGGTARLTLRLTTSHDGAALARVLPAVWIDAAGRDDVANENCVRRIARYARASALSPQALVDVNGYDVLVMNADASVSAIDPRTQLAGRTSLRASIPLPGPGFDWVASNDDARLFVSVPSAAALATADLATMKAGATIALAGPPGRVRMSPDGGRVWVGVPAGKDADAAGGIAVVDAGPPHAQRWLPLARGHVDFAFDPAGWVAVTQRGQPRMTFIDPTVLEVVHQETLPPDSQPLAVVFDAAQRRFIVADAKLGRLRAFGARGRPAGEMALQPGIGPMTLSPDGRWLFVANPATHAVDVIDLPAWRHAHRLPVSGRPYEIAMTAEYAYLRALDSEAVHLVALASLAAAPRVQRIAVGERAPGRVAGLPIAAAMVPMPAGGSFIVSPADNSVYFYMEGMNAPAGSVSARGSEARAVRVARRGLRETAPGRYASDVVLPAHERLVLAVATEAPRTRQCVALDGVLAAAQKAPDAVALQWEALPGAGGDSRIRVRIAGLDAGALPPALHLRLLTPGGGAATEVRAEGDGQGRYSAPVPRLAAGLWYVHAPTLPGDAAGTAPYASFVVEPRR